MSVKNLNGIIIQELSLKEEKIDLDKLGQLIKESILENLKFGNFEYEFLPEDENLKESYSISNDYLHFYPRRKMINARLLIKVKVSHTVKSFLVLI